MSGPKYTRQFGEHERKLQLLVLGVVFISCVSAVFFECGATYAVLEAPIDT